MTPEQVAQLEKENAALRESAMLLVRQEERLHILQSQSDLHIERLRALLGINARIAVAQGLTSILEEAGRGMVSEMNFERVVAIALDGDSGKVAYHVGYPTDQQLLLSAETPVLTARWPFTELGTQEVAVVDVTSADSKDAAAFFSRFGLEKALVALLTERGKPWGFLIGGYSSSRSYAYETVLRIGSDETLALFGSIAKILSVAFANVSLIADLRHRTEELDMANQSLERRVEERMSLIRATLDAAADGILVVDQKGKIVDYNERFRAMWNIPMEVLALKDDEKALAFVRDQLTDPESFLKSVHDAYADQRVELSDVIEFKDGRAFERHSLPHTVGGRTVGRVWSFRDITDRRRAEEARKRHMEDLERLNQTMIGRELKMVELKKEISELKAQSR